MSVQWQPLILELGGNPYHEQKDYYISAAVWKEKLNMYLSIIICQLWILDYFACEIPGGIEKLLWRVALFVDVRTTS